MSACIELHTYGPKNSVEWHEWAALMSETHDQYQCPNCGLWEVWVPKEKNK